MIVGRHRERARLGAFDPAEPVLVLLGILGTGKSLLLHDAARRAAGAGRRVVRITGSESESSLAYSGLHQLLPAADLAALPARQRAALRQACGLGDNDGVPNPMQVGIAVLALLSALSATLVVIDDADRLDRPSLDALAFAARRIDGRLVTMLLGARDPVPAFDHGFAVLELGPLGDHDAATLLDMQPGAPIGRDRLLRLSAAGGNPLALLDPGSADLFAGQISGLPETTFLALLHLALEPPEPHVDLLGLPPGLVRRDGVFTHPLARLAVHRHATPSQRREVHASLAATLHDAGRRALHLAASADGADAAVAAELRRDAVAARESGQIVLSGLAFENAADLVTDPVAAAGLLVDATAAAVASGNIGWAHDLTNRVRRITTDARLCAGAEVLSGRLAVLTGRHITVFDRLTRAAQEFAGDRPDEALQLVASASTVAFYSGQDDHRRHVANLLLKIGDQAGPAWLRDWATTVIDPAETPGSAPASPFVTGVLAWMRDDLPTAVRAFDEHIDRWGPEPPQPDMIGGAAAWSYAERGRWDDAQRVCDRLIILARSAGLDHALACVHAAYATILALRGDIGPARSAAAEALARVDPLESRSVAAQAHRALGLAAMADGDAETAWIHLRALFGAAGEPLHYRLSTPVLGDLAAVGVQARHQPEADMIVAENARRLAGHASPRMAAVLARAQGLLAEDAEPHLRAALARPELRFRPFEHAQTLLDLAGWLRRQRRISEARPVLTEALEIFDRLGSRPWADRARVEARAAGLDIAASAPTRLTLLTSQEREIAVLAARGLTNREIGERLFLSPRTVSSHLYRIFPKLGITARTQLRDLIDP